MSKIKFDKKDFEGASAFWGLVFKWSEAVGEAKSEQAEKLDKAVQRLIKKYVKRERKRLARVMQDQQKIAIDGFLENLAADWRIPVRKLTGNGAPIGKAEESELERFFTREPKPMSWPTDFQGKH